MPRLFSFRLRQLVPHPRSGARGIADQCGCAAEGESPSRSISALDSERALDRRDEVLDIPSRWSALTPAILPAIRIATPESRVAKKTLSPR